MNILSFDIEDWFHILDFEETADIRRWNDFESRVERGVNLILDMLDEYNQKGTFFCLGWIAEHHPNVIAEIHARGHEIGTHSNNHGLVYSSNYRNFRHDLRRSIDLLQDITGSKIDMYRAPGFSITSDCLWAFDALIEEGIQIDCSVFPAARRHGGLSSWGNHKKPFTLRCVGGSLKCFPINTLGVLGKNFVFSGGGYFRLIPFHMLEFLLRRSSYNMTYFHPRDFDIGQPVLSGLNMLRRFQCYVGISKAETKLRKLLQNLEFMTVNEAIRKVEWNIKHEIKLDLN